MFSLKNLFLIKEALESRIDSLRDASGDRLKIAQLEQLLDDIEILIARQ